MKYLIIYFFVIGFFSTLSLSAQVEKAEATSFILKGKVVNANDNSPVTRVNIEVQGRSYTTTNRAGEFQLEAMVGDELIVRSDDFKTVYHTIENSQKITIRVEEAEDNSLPISKSSSRSISQDYFRVYIDSAKYYLKKDAKKSIEYVTKALENVSGNTATATENAQAFEMLGDINLYWQLSDLAVSNYKQSIRFNASVTSRIKLAKAYTQNGNYQESISAYKELLSESLSPYQQIEVYEGLGDNYKATNDAVKSVFNYQKGLDIANTRNITPKITDLNSKIGEAYAKGGAIEEAEDYFENSLNLSKGQNKKRAVVLKNFKFYHVAKCV